MKKTHSKSEFSSPDFRPSSYWQNDDPLAAILQNIKGEARRRLITDAWNKGSVEHLNDALLDDSLDEETRHALGRIHPSLMGGEYLLAYQPGEVEVARISIASATSDVVSIRARPEPGDQLIHYRIVDEYPKSNSFRTPWKNSTHPLTFAEMIRFIDESSDEFGTGLGLCYTEYNAEDEPDPEDLHGFTAVSSEFYPALADHFDKIHQAWVNERIRAAEGDDEDDEDDDYVTFPSCRVIPRLP